MPATATEILCRLDPATRTPVVFLSDTFNGDQIQVWKGQGNPEYVPLAYYHMTSMLSADDERVLAERFKNGTGRQSQIVKVRHRLPRTARPVPSILTGGESFNANQPRANVQEGPKQADRRNPHARSIDTMPVPPAPQIISERELPEEATVPQGNPVAQPQMSVAQASPAEVLTMLAQMSLEFNQRMTALANMLAPVVVPPEQQK